MNLARVLIELTEMSLPERTRARYREEWMADLQHAPELGISRASVVVGALAGTAALNRDDPVVTGIPADIETIRRARWSAAFLCGALVIGGGAFVFSFERFDSPLGTGALTAILAIMVAVVACLALIGIVAGIRALRIGLPVYGPRRVTATVLLSAGAVLALVVTSLFPIIGALWGLSAVAVALFLAAGGPRRQPPQQPMRASSRVGLSTAFSLATVGVVALGALHILVWNPLAKMPGMTLDEIYAAMAAAGQPADFAGVAFWAVLFVGAAVALPICCSLRRFAGPRSTRRIVVAGSTLVAGAAGTSWLAGFAMGMNLADAFFVSGSDAAPGGLVLTAVTVLALLAAVFAALVPVRWREPASPAVLA